jgi:hypothetical protein
MKDRKGVILVRTALGVQDEIPSITEQMFATRTRRKSACYRKAVGVQDEMICSIRAGFGNKV